MNSPSLAQRWARFVLLLVSLVGLAACGGGGGGGGRSLTRIEVTPAAASIAAGTTQQFVATAIYSDNTREDVSGSASWVSSDPSRATVSTTGLATGKAAGSTTIAASSGGVTGTAPLTVTAAALRSIAVTAAKPSIAKGQTDAFTATGTYSDNSTQDITNSVAWSSSDPSIATVSNASGSRGLAQGVAPGNATITATQGSLSGSLGLRVTAAVLTQLSVTPKTVSLAKGTGQQYAATAIFSDNSTQDVTAATSWSSSDPTVATIATGNSSAGLAQAVGVGSATISGTYMGLSDTGSLQVTAAALVSIAVTPSTPSIAKGLTQQFTATGTYTDNSTQDLTTTVTWSSGTTAVATISNASGSQGLAQGAGTGQSTITAAQPSGTITGTATLTVTAAVIKSLSITPPSATIAKGTTQQYAATATFSDDSTQDVTTATTWSSSDTAIATISNAAGSQGLAGSAGIGDATVTGSYSGATASASLSVSAAQLVSIAVTPSNPSIAKGLSQPFTATGVYTDNSTQDLTTAVTWASSSSSIATISNASGSQGVAQSVAVGSTKITATQSGGSISGITTLTVTAATLSRIDVTPATPTVPKGLTQTFTATAVYTDSSTQDVTTSVNWSSSNTSIGTISNASGSKGLFKALAQGTATIGAADAASGVSGSTLATVSAASLTAIGITPANSKVAQGFSIQYAATGTYSDSTTSDITASVTWASADAAVATISNTSGSQGLATATATAGNNAVIISASLGGVSSSTNLTTTSATLSSIAVTPANPSVPKGLTQQFTATGTFSDGSTSDLTTQVSWSSSDSSVATVSNSKGSKGVASAAAASGSTTITAALINAANASPGKSGSATLTATAAVVTDFTVSPLNASLAKGLTLQYSAMGKFSDGTTGDVTSAVTWSSSSTSVATISNASGSKGLATAAGVGTTNIGAVVNSITRTTPLTVTAAVVKSITVSPSTPSVAAGVSQQFAATGTYTDGTTATITTAVTWSSSNTDVATISNASGSQGLASTYKTGSVSIVAVDPATGVSNANSSPANPATLTVTAAVLNSIVVSPDPSSVSTGASTQLTAVGNYSDNTHPDLTNQATWTSSATTVATVGAMTGVVSGVTPGSATITATYGGKSATSALTVNKAALTRIQVSFPNGAAYSNPSQVPVGYALQYTAVGYYADNTNADITTSVTWASASASVASVSNASGSKGVVTGAGAGSTSITASLNGVTSNNANASVTTAKLTAISVSPKNATTARNATLQFVATATFDDGSTIDIARNNGVTWASSNTQVATIDQNGVTTGGSLAGSNLASSTISASKGGVSGSTTLN